MMDNQSSCDVSRSLNEPLYGTIKPADVFFLLEYNGTYEKEAWDAAEVPQAVKDKLNAFPNGHTILIRQPGKFAEHDRMLTLFVVHASAVTPQIYRLDLETYEDVLDIDIEAILRGEIIIPEDDPLYVVCTNGKRDTCCAKWGVELYNAFIPLVGDMVWQSSHIGGHRLAATMYCFPHALCYGYLGAADAPNVVESYQNERILLDKLRGRAIVSKPVQAAEYFLRRELNETQISALRYGEHTTSDEGWIVHFTDDTTSYQVAIAKAAPIDVVATTGDAQHKAIPQYKFMSYEAQ